MLVSRLARRAPRTGIHMTQTVHECPIVLARDRSRSPGLSFFICTDGAEKLDGQYTAFGVVAMRARRRRPVRPRPRHG